MHGPGGEERQGKRFREKGCSPWGEGRVNAEQILCKRAYLQEYNGLHLARLLLEAEPPEGGKGEKLSNVSPKGSIFSSR